MSRKLKEMMVDELAKQYADINDRGCVLVSYKGVKAGEEADLRHRLRASNASMTVVRNAMFRIAMERVGATALKDAPDGPTAVVYGDDAVSVAKAVRDLAKDMQHIQLQGGYAEGQVLDAAGVEALADLPSREELLSMTLTCMLAPAQRFVNGIVTAMSRVAGVFDELRKKKEAEGGGEAAQES